MAEKIAKAPKWLLKREGITQRQWKQMKRQELRELKKSLWVYGSGCAFCPSYDGRFGTMVKLVNELIESHSVKNWGR